MGLLSHPTTQGGTGGPHDRPNPVSPGLYDILPPDRIAHILAATGRQSRRVRRLPADAAARLVVALGLFADLPVPQVWRRLHPGADAPDPVESAFCQARDRLGVPPMRHLFDAVARPMATHQTVGAMYHGWRLMGSTRPPSTCPIPRPMQGLRPPADRPG